MVYLLKMEVKNGSYYKVGFASNLAKRLNYYGTHNPCVECIETVQTYKKTKHQLETEIHKEILEQGFKFENAKINGKKTEWFFVPEGTEITLKQFKCCKNRKVNEV